MAKKRAYRPPPKESPKAHFASLDKKVIAELTGYRPLTVAERVKLGLPKTTRAYTTQKEGVKKLDKSKIAPRRRVEEQALELLTGRRVTFEEKADRNFEARGLRSPLDRYHRIRDEYIKNTYHGPIGYKNTKRGVKTLYPTQVSKARADSEFKALYKQLKNKSRTKRATIARLRALDTLYPEEGEFREYLQRYAAA